MKFAVLSVCLLLALPSGTFAQSLEQRVDKLEKQNRELQTRIASLQARPVLNVSGATDGAPATPRPKTCTGLNDIGDPEGVKSCPRGYYVSGFKNGTSGNQSLDMFFCCPLSK